MSMIDIRVDKPLFPLGQVVITRNAAGQLAESDIQSALRRHAGGDWGEVCAEDWQANDHALENIHRILSVYVAQNRTKFWIITEADRSATTVLLPEDY
jgi:hypothetical protein